MNITVTRDNKDFLALKEDWNKLSSALSTVTRFEWMYKWWQHFNENKELNILVAKDKGKVLGIAPLCIENTKALKLLPFRRLCFLGGEISDYLDFMIIDNNREPVFKALLDYALNNLDYDLLELGHINSTYPNFDLWQKYSENAKFAPAKECHRIRLTNFNSYEDYYDKLSRNLKDKLRKSNNRLKKEGFSIEYGFQENITRQDIDTIARLNIDRQKFLYKKGQLDRFCYFADRKKTDFIYDFFSSQGDDPKVLAYIKLNGKIVSYHLMLPNQDTLSLWNTAFNSEYDKYNPAKLLIIEIIKYAFENNFKTFDFMRGNDPHKLNWTNDMAVNHTLIKKKSIKSHIVSLYRETAPRSLLRMLQSNNDIYKPDLQTSFD